MEATMSLQDELRISRGKPRAFYMPVTCLRCDAPMKIKSPRSSVMNLNNRIASLSVFTALTLASPEIAAAQTSTSENC
jgi:hypothetical protein